MRLFYLTYGNTPDRLEKALKLAWTQNVTILEACEAAEERAWYLNAALENMAGIRQNCSDRSRMARGGFIGSTNRRISAILKKKKL